MSNLTLKSNLDYDAPQGMQASYEEIAAQNAKQDALIDATSTGVGGGIRRRKKKSMKKKKMYGGETSLPPYPNSPPKGFIEVPPLPAGSQTGNTQTNNIQNAQTYAESVQNADGDKYVSTGDPAQSGGKRKYKRRTNRNKIIKSKKRRTNKTSRKGNKRKHNKTRRGKK